jgi:hypothetical protein
MDRNNKRQGWINYKADLDECLELRMKKVPMKVKLRKKGAYEVKMRAKDLYKFFCPAYIKKCN